MKILAVIPARFASTRLPGKPLIKIGEKTMVQRVYERVKACKAFEEVVVATDDTRIHDHVQGFGGNSVMTKVDHPSGTDRCNEALKLQSRSYDYIVNIQGDEPFIDPVQLTEFCGLLDGQVEIASQYRKITDTDSIENANVVKVVTTDQGRALYFSRSPIPFPRNPDNAFYKQHIGLYAYRTDVLEQITSLPTSPLEQAESLEQLRWLEAGFHIQMQETTATSIGIDTQEDVIQAEAWLKKQ